MSVAELIEILKNYPQNAKVAVSCWESQELARNTVLAIKGENAPGTGADDVWFMHNIPEDEQILFIE